MTRFRTPNERTKQRKERRRRQAARSAGIALAPTIPKLKPVRTLKKRRAYKFEMQGGICHWFIEAQRNGTEPRCPRDDGQMTLDLTPSGKAPKNYASFEHLHRRRDGGLGKHDNVVLACQGCNSSRDAGVQLEKPKPENVEAKLMSDGDLLEGLRRGMLTDAARGQLYSRGLVPNWPMWTKIMAHVPLGPH